MELKVRDKWWVKVGVRANKFHQVRRMEEGEGDARDGIRGGTRREGRRGGRSSDTRVWRAVPLSPPCCLPEVPRGKKTWPDLKEDIDSTILLPPPSPSPSPSPSSDEGRVAGGSIPLP
eukprot:745619-Hanusia_phi.AAC.2